MRSIYYLPVSLLLLLCALNLYLGIITKPDPGFFIYVLFGVIYFVLGALVMCKRKSALWIVFILPLAILILYPVTVSFKNLHPWSSGFLGAINAMVVICCLILIMLRIKD
jgi:hypothetical protein